MTARARVTWTILGILALVSYFLWLTLKVRY